ncbi:MAG: hypothetical protein AAB531_02240 [Patescibacteria group bacterium]
MPRHPEVENRPPTLSELVCTIKSLPVLIYDGSEPVSGLATVENEKVPPQTKRIIELAGHSVTGETKVKGITYINNSSSKHVDISVSWENDHRTNKSHLANIYGLNLTLHNGRNELKPFAIARLGGTHYVSEDYSGTLHPEDFDNARKFIRKFKQFSASDRASFVMEIIDAIKDFPHKMPWNTASDI